MRTITHRKTSGAQHFTVLLVALITFFLAEGLRGYAEHLLPGIVIAAALTVLFAGVLISAVVEVTENQRSEAKFLRTMLIVTIAMRLGCLVLPWTALVLGYHLGTMICFLYVFRFLFHYLFQARTADFNTISAAICTFLMLGIFWAELYSLLDVLEPGSFSSPLLEAEDAFMSLGSDKASPALYYSIVTLTTLGYGDITPISSAARTFSSLEAITGQVFMAVLVARLVGLSTVPMTSNKSGKD